MKKLSVLACLVIALVSSLSCEQQTWEQTKLFNQKRHSHGSSHDAHDPHAPAAHSAKPPGETGVSTPAAH